MSHHRRRRRRIATVGDKIARARDGAQCRVQRASQRSNGNSPRSRCETRDWLVYGDSVFTIAADNG